MMKPLFLGRCAIVLGFATVLFQSSEAATIGIDARHTDSIVAPHENLATGANHVVFRQAIIGAGHSLVSLTSFTANQLAGVDALILKQPGGFSTAFATSEITDIHNFVNAGHGLLVLGEGGWSTDETVPNLNSLVSPFGVAFDRFATQTGGLTVTGFRPHAVTQGITRVGVDFHRPMLAISSPAIDLTLGSGEDDILAAIDGTNGTGNVVLVSDATLWADASAAADRHIEFEDNRLLLNNVIAFITAVAGDSLRIVQQPQSQISAVGRSVTFAVVASGGLPLFYQWRFNGSPIQGQTGPSLTLPSVNASDAGNYDVLVSNARGSVTSALATLRVVQMFYVNDGSTQSDEWCTAPGDDANDGLSAATPKASVESILDAYRLGPGATVYLDTGVYPLIRGITVASTHSGSSASPVTFQASPYGVTFSRSAGAEAIWTIAADHVVLTTALSTKYAGRAQSWMKISAPNWGIHLQGRDCSVRRCEIVHQNVGIVVGGPSFSGSNTTVENCVIRGASATAARGIDIGPPQGSATIRNCTIFGHNQFGVAVYEVPGTRLSNNIILAEGPAVFGPFTINVQLTTVQSDYNDLFAINGAGVGLTTQARQSLNDWQTATGNDLNSISRDPLFVGLAEQDFHLRSSGGSYHGGVFSPDFEDSPALDMGDPLVSAESEPLPNGGRINLGAYGGTEQASKSPRKRNSPPTLNSIPSLAISEDALEQTVPLTGISSGAIDEIQTLGITGISGNVALIPDPLVTYSSPNSNGTLRFRPVPDAFGMATVTVTVSDGALENSTVTQTFSVVVLSVNDAPSFTKGANQVVDEDGPLRQVLNWATNRRAGPPNEATQILSFQVSNNNTALFSTQPAIDSNGTLTFTPAPNQNGSATVTVVLRDNGGTDNGGVDSSAPQTFTISLNPVNDPPVLRALSDQTVLVGSNVTLQAIATDVDVPSDLLIFSLDAGAPAGASINAATGLFTFTPTSAQAQSTNLVTVRVTDTGSPPLSDSKSFTIIVRERLVAPVITQQPQSQSKTAGEDVTFSVVAVGTAPLSYQWRFNGANITGATSPTLLLSNVQTNQTGNYSVLVSNSVGSTNSIEARLTVVSPVTAKPTVRIVAPADRAIFQLGEQIRIEVSAEATAPAVRIQQVAFFAGTTRLAEVTAAPYVFTWSNAELGDYSLTARAVDDQGATGQSLPVQIVVGDACGRIALIASGNNPDRVELREAIYELGIKHTIIERSEAAVTNLMAYDLIIWDQTTQSPLTEREVLMLRELSEQGKSFYFIGDNLVGAAAQLSAPAQSQWSGLIHVQGTAGAIAAGQVLLDEVELHPVVVNGKVGTVSDFALTISGPRLVARGSAGETVLASRGDSAVVVAFQDMTLAQTARTLTQVFPIATGGDAASQAQRRKLFQNAVWWLLNCRQCSTLSLTPKGSISTEVAEVGQELTYRLEIEQTGACEGLGVILVSQLPPGIEFLEARSQRGQWNHRDGVVTFAVGRMTSAQRVSLEVVVRPSQSGHFTNVCYLSSINESGGGLQDNRLEITNEVRSLQSGVRLALRMAGGVAEITAQGPEGRQYILEATGDLRTWTSIQTNRLSANPATFLDPASSAVRARVYRARVLP